MHLYGRGAERGRSLAREPSRASLCQVSPAADFHAHTCPPDSPVSGVGGGGTGRAFRSAPLAPCKDRRLHPVPLVASCRRCRPHPRRRPHWSRQVGAAGADGAAIPAVSRRSEEHTSELQSIMRISYAVFCLKKKNTQIRAKYIYRNQHIH